MTKQELENHLSKVNKKNRDLITENAMLKSKIEKIQQSELYIHDLLKTTEKRLEQYRIDYGALREDYITLSEKFMKLGETNQNNDLNLNLVEYNQQLLNRVLALEKIVKDNQTNLFTKDVTDNYEVNYE